MMRMLMVLLPDKLVFICTILSFIIPFIMYKAQQLLHEHGNPSWMKERW